MSKSELVEEVDGVTAYMLDDGTVKRIFPTDWGVRLPERIKLLHDLVAVRPDKELGVTEGGIHVPDNVQDDQFNRGDFIKSSNQHHSGLVMEVGPGRRDQRKGRRLDLDLEVGDRVCYHRASATGVTWHDGDGVVLIHADGGEKGDAIIWKEEKNDTR